MSDNKKIFKNTLFLYFRIIFIISINLFTVRLVYQVLGIEDFGLFSLITSFILLFSFLNSAMRSGTQRFLNVALASKNESTVQKTFYVALKIHLSIAIVVVIALETLGLWWVNNYLNMPIDKAGIANIVYQSAILNMFFNILSVPYQAMIIARERINVFAYITIIDAILKFLTVLGTLYLSLNYQALFVYSILLVIVSIIIFVLYFYFSKVRFRKEKKSQNLEDKKLAKEIIIFSSWNLFGQMSVLSSNQGVVLIYNIFFGIFINASLAISQQVSALLNNFVSNLQLAFNPQIVQSYAKQDFERHIILVLNSSKYSLYLITIIAIPFLLYSEFILKLWLGSELPQYATYFSFIVVLVAFFDALSGPLWMSVHANGNMKKYQIVISIIFLLNLPLTLIFLKISMSLYFSFLTYLIVAIATFIYRLYYFFSINSVSKKMKFDYIKKIILGFCFVFFIFLYNYIDRVDDLSLISCLSRVFVFEIIFLTYLIVLCLTKGEVYLIKKFILNKLNFNRSVF